MSKIISQKAWIRCFSMAILVTGGTSAQAAENPPATQPVPIRGEWRSIDGGKTGLITSAVVYPADGSCLIASYISSIARVWPTNKDLKPTPLVSDDIYLPWSCVSNIAVNYDASRALTGVVGCNYSRTALGPAPQWDYEANAHVWDRASGKELFRLKRKKEEGAITGTAISADGKIGATQSRERIGLWDLTKGKELHSYILPDNQQFGSVSMSADGKRVASCTDRTVYVWDAQTFKEICHLTAPEWAPVSVALSPNGRLLLWGGIDGKVRFVDVDHQQTTATVDMHAPLHAVTLSPDGQYFAAVSYDRMKRASSYDYDTFDSHCLVGDVKTQSWISRSPQSPNGRIFSIALSPTKSELAAATEGDVRIWDWKPEK